MKKWNKHNTKFILRSVAISSFAIFIWSLFYTYQINENYLNISLTHEEAKEEAIQYLKSRGWDISGYTYAISHSKTSGDWGHNASYWFEIAGNKDKKKIDNLLNFAYNIIRAGNNKHKNKMNSMHTLILVLFADELQSRFDCKIDPQIYVKKFFEVNKVST